MHNRLSQWIPANASAGWRPPFPRRPPSWLGWPRLPIGIGAIPNSDAGKSMFTMAITLTVLCVLLGGVVVWSHLK